jgi:hypothetical protein
MRPHRHVATVATASLLAVAGCGAATTTAPTPPGAGGAPATVGSLTVQASGWTLHASTSRGELALVLDAPGSGSIPAYCGGPGFAAHFFDSQGDTVTTPPQVAAQYCMAGTTRTASYDFTVPQAAGTYAVKIALRDRSGALPLQLSLIRSTAGELGLAH